MFCNIKIIYLLPMTGANTSMANPLNNMWRPKAEGNFSGTVCSDILMLKLHIKAARTIPHREANIRVDVRFFCQTSAGKNLKFFKNCT